MEQVAMNGLDQHQPAGTINIGSSASSRLCRPCAAVVSLCCITLCLGCIERTISINTEPEEATVFLNDQEVGRSPIKVPFTWYGDYDIIIRKKGYQTICTHHRVRAPWYELPGIDIITECLIPFTVHDDRVLDTFVLEPQQLPSKEVLLDAAADMRSRALSEES